MTTKQLRPARWGIAVLALASCAIADAQPYRCTAANGKVSYSDRVCPDTSEQRAVSIVDNTTDSTELRRESKRISEERTKPVQGKASEPGKSASGSEVAQTGRGGQTGPKESNAEACAKAKRSYAVEASSIKKDVAAIDARYAEAKTACGGDVEMESNHRTAQAEEQARQKRAAEEREREAVRASFAGARVVRCDASGCQTTAGRLSGSSPNLTGPYGVVCRTEGSTLTCR